MSNALICDRCGSALAPGSLKFNVRIALTADFDGHLSEPGRQEEGSLREALEECEGQTEDELMAGVHQELAFLVCPRCRGELLTGPLEGVFLRHGGGMVQ